MTYQNTSTLSILHLWIEAFEFHAGIMSGALPPYPFLDHIAPLVSRLCFLSERRAIWHSATQALQGQGTEFDLSTIEPTAMRGGIVHLQT